MTPTLNTFNAYMCLHCIPHVEVFIVMEAFVPVCMNVCREDAFININIRGKCCIFTVTNNHDIHGSSFFLGKVTSLGVLCCFALLLFVFDCFFLPSHLIKTCIYMFVCLGYGWVGYFTFLFFLTS